MNNRTVQVSLNRRAWQLEFTVAADIAWNRRDPGGFLSLLWAEGVSAEATRSAITAAAREHNRSFFSSVAKPDTSTRLPG
jgi:hypothetical protein